ncbi:MAG: hypothetical protein MJZ36_09010 [Bacteroidaceae bacterium]|nr:hypothetical protein [Bacteroidaceae bacterium]
MLLRGSLFLMCLYANALYNIRVRESNGLSRSAQFNADPSSYGDVVAVMDSLMQNPFQSGISSITLSKTRSESLQNGTNWNFSQEINYNKKTASGDRLFISPKFIHKQQSGTEHNAYQLDYIQGQGQNDFDFAPSSMLQNLLSMLLTRHKVEEGTPFFLYLLSTLKKFSIFVAKSRFLRYISKNHLKMEQEWN